MHDNSWIWVLIPLAAIGAGVARTWVRARHGYPLDRHDRRDARMGRGHRAPAEEIAELKNAVAARDATIAKLEDRVRVLERIATDRPAALREEIERL
ncbi:MAG TPA: hypothetical protein VFX89_19040 [Gammaproteobacteria bacterium]|nr:hypothetical protein [Gammaproteobacteria bacterium]